MNRRRLGRTAVAAAAVVTLAGCGVPAQTGVVDDGPGRARDLQTNDNPPVQTIPRTDTNDPVTFINNYLAVAGAGEVGTADRRLREYLPEEEAGWRPAGDINVVRVRDSSGLEDKEQPEVVNVTVEVDHVGVLGRDGVLRAPTQRAAAYVFAVSRLGREPGLFLRNPPDAMLMSTEALGRYFDPRTIYFWDTENSGLVPDVRYMSKAIPRSGRPNEILQWLIQGPSEWLAPVVAELPPDIKRNDNVVPNQSGRLEVNISTANPGDLDRLAAQLRWSLRQDTAQTALELKIDGQTRKIFTDDAYLRTNPAYSVSPSPERFAVYAGRVVRLRSPNGTAAPGLSVATNVDVRSAALARSRDNTAVALVRAGASGLRLWIGVGVGLAPARLTAVGGPVAAASAPVWVPRGGSTGLIAMDGTLRWFEADGAPRIGQLTTRQRDVTAVAVSPEGRRVGYVAAGRLYVAPLIRLSGGEFRLGTALQVRTTLRDLTGVGWTREDQLIAAGRRPDADRVALYEISLDGVIEIRREQSLSPAATVTHLAAYPGNPTSVGGFAMYVYNGAGYDLSTATPLTVNDLGGVTEVPGQLPSAPFFLG